MNNSAGSNSRLATLVAPATYSDYGMKWERWTIP